MFDDEFIENLPENKLEALKKIVVHFNSWDSRLSTVGETDKFEIYLEA
jgi:hypothetical protein